MMDYTDTELDELEDRQGLVIFMIQELQDELNVIEAEIELKDSKEYKEERARGLNEEHEIDRSGYME